jgi:4-alpha-glucanotransferase
VTSRQHLRPDGWGLHLRWYDAHSDLRTLSDETVRRLRTAIGRPPADLEDRAPIVTRPGRDLGVGRAEVLCEDGSIRYVAGALPADFPLGYHLLRPAAGAERRLIVSPGRCWLPKGFRAWGWTTQLYAMRSRSSWGIGDLADLRSLREWSASLGAGYLMVSPLHAAAPVLPLEDSPYLPVTRRFRNPIYLRVDGVDERLAERGHALNGHPLIDRDAVWSVKEEALRGLFAARAADGEFEQWRREQGGPLRDFASWCALAKVHGPDWRTWDPALHDPHSPAVTAFADAHSDEIAFHAWLQWLLDRQVREATADLPVIQDLPIGVDGGGADAWAWQETLAQGVMVGAPPDIFNSAGQSWGSPPFVPWRLRAADYEPFVESIRATMAGSGGIRIDHVMGLFRLWWVPEGGDPVDGAYVRYPSRDLLNIVALESHRARALVVGEDLGTVEPGVRETLAAHGILSYKLLWFEDSEPAEWPISAMAAATTHDLPTVAGLWSGSDMAEQRRYTSAPPEELERGRIELVRRLGDLPPDASAEEAVRAAYRRLSQAPCALVSATLEDAVAEERRPNLPGVLARPNWRLPLPVLVEDLPTHPLATAVAAILGEATGRRRHDE